jgi:filamentous hemagglutinin family protein
MNKVYNVIWSKAHNAWVVVAEGSKAAAKAGGVGLKLLIALIMLSPLAGNAASLPQGGVISVGQGTVVSNGSNEMIIKQTSDKLGINWQSFNVGADGHVIFDQPGKHSVALNRVIGSDGSAILGKIDANGQVFLINPNGVIFGKDSKVNVGGLVASTLDISDEDFKAGNYKLAAVAGDAGVVVNNGSLQAAEGGYIALLGKTVKNNGLIKARLGTAAMAAGDAMTLDFSGDGLINVQVTKSAVKALVDNQGLIQADGGSVLMTARATNALMDTVVNNDGVIQAQTINQKTGKIFLDGGPVDGTGVVTVGGTLDASAPTMGNGGLIETSGKIVQVKRAAKVTTFAASGKYGAWLLDPDDFNIDAGNGAQTSSSIGASTLAAALESTNVTLQTASSGASGGNINVNADVSWSANTTLTLNADKQVYIKANISASGESAGLTLNGTGYTISGGKKVTLSGGSSTFFLNGQGYTVIHSSQDLQDISDMSGHYVIGNDIDMSDTLLWNSGEGFSPIGMSGSEFSGVLDGFNHSLTSLNINRPTQNNIGIFGATQSARIGNFSVSGSVTGGDNTGMVSGYSSGVSGNYGEIYNVTTSGSVVGGNYTGSLSGNLSQVGLQYITNNASVYGMNETGGVAGSVSGNGSYGWHYMVINNGDVHGQDTTGGLFGQGYANLQFGKNTGSVTGGVDVGGLIGTTGNQVIDSYNTGYISGYYYVGGLFGTYNGANWFYSDYSSGDVVGTGLVGGIVGYFGNGQAWDVFATGNVKGDDYVGGWAGKTQSSQIHDVYASGDVEGTNSGGLIGNSNGVILQNSYSSGKADFGLIGEGSGSISNSYWNTETSGTSVSNGGIGKTTVELKNPSLFGSGWTSGSSGSGPWLKAFMNRLGLADTQYSEYGSTINLSDIAYSKGYSLTDVDWFSGKSYADLFSQDRLTSGGSSFTNAGTYKADFATGQFDSIIDYTFVITKKSLTATINPVSTSKVYDGTENASINFSLSGMVSGDDVALSGVSGHYDSKNASSSNNITIGGYSLTGIDALNYSVYVPGTFSGSISKAHLDVIATGSSKVYDGTTGASYTLSATPIGSDNIVISSSGGSYSDKNVGAGKTITVNGITVSGADAGNYSWDNSVVATGDISKYVSNVTMHDTGKFYDGTVDGNADFSYLSFGGDDINLAIKLKYSSKNAGTGLSANVASVNATGADAGNYDFVLDRTVVNAQIDKRLIDVSATGHDKVYDGSTAALVDLAGKSFQITGAGFDTTGITGVIAGDDLHITGSASFADKNAGAGKTVSVTGLSLSGSDANNYYIYPTGSPVQTTASISKANLVISGVSTSKVYDGTTVATGSVGSSHIAGDDIVVTYGSAAFSDKNAGIGKTINYTGVNVTGADAGNYAWSSVATGIGDITKATLAVTAVGASKTYDGTTSASTTLSDNRIGSDDLVLSSSSNFADKNAGTGKTILVTGIQVTGADAGNYNYNVSATTTGDVAKANLVITANGIDKVYDGTKNASVNFVDNRLGSDSLIITGNSAFGDKNAGANKGITVDGIQVAGIDSGNYNWNTIATTAAEISKAYLRISAAAQNKTYDSTKGATVTLSDDRVAGDDLLVSPGVSEFADKNAGLHKTVTSSGITVLGADAGNYTFDTQVSTTADIGKAALSIKADSTGKTVGAADGPLDWSIQAGQLFGSDQIDGTLVRAAGEASGNYSITQGTLDAGSNYDMSFTVGNFAINAVAVPPVDPTPPVGPTEPTDPTPPVGPTEPVDPTPPVGPSEPQNPSQPDGPSIPVEPPTLPQNPEDPSQPTGPIDPVPPSKAIDAIKGTVNTIATTRNVDSTKAGMVERPGDYRLLNLGMKLPDELISSDGAEN